MPKVTRLISGRDGTETHPSDFSLSTLTLNFLCIWSPLVPVGSAPHPACLDLRGVYRGEGVSSVT